MSRRSLIPKTEKIYNTSPGQMHIDRDFLFNQVFLTLTCNRGQITRQHAVPIGHFPGSIKNKLSSFDQQVIINLIWSVCGFMIIFVNSVEIKNYRNTFACKIEMIAAVVYTLRILGIIKFIIELEPSVFFIHRDTNRMQV